MDEIEESDFRNRLAPLRFRFSIRSSRDPQRRPGALINVFAEHELDILTHVCGQSRSGCGASAPGLSGNHRAEGVSAWVIPLRPQDMLML